MKRRLYVVEERLPGCDWEPTGGSCVLLRDAKRAARSHNSVYGWPTRVVSYGPHDQLVKTRPLLLLRAKKAPDS